MMRNNEKDKFMWRATKLCATLLFALFSFLYLYCMQADLLACFQYILSDGLTSYSPLVGGLIITLLLVFLGELLAYACPLPTPFVALSYFPSAVLLAVISGGTPKSDGIGFAASGWTWVAVTVVVVGVCMLLLRKYASYLVQDKYRYTDSWPNALLFFLMFAFVGKVGNTNDRLHYQLKAESLLNDECYDEILEMRPGSTGMSPAFHAIRALALSQDQRLGEELFRARGLSGSSDLLVSEHEFLSCDSLEYKFYDFWGARPGKHLQQNSELFFQIILERNLCDSTRRKEVQDLYLSSLLLDRKIDQFASSVVKYYPLNDSLPRHYREALILYKRIRTAPVCVYENESLEENYNDYLTMSRNKVSAQEVQNKIRQSFGRTYWYYYNYR